MISSLKYIHSRRLLRIAAFLGVSTDKILECRSFAHVYYVRVEGRRPTFVSKMICSGLIGDVLIIQCFTGEPWQQDQTRQQIANKLREYRLFKALASTQGLNLTFDDLGFYLNGIAFSTFNRFVMPEYHRRNAILVAKHEALKAEIITA
jgi:hypothetical protein